MSDEEPNENTASAVDFKSIFAEAISHSASGRMKVPKFSGRKPTEIIEWIEEYEIEADARGWGETKKLQNVAPFLTDYARSWYILHCLTDGPGSQPINDLNWDRFKKGIIEHFIPAGHDSYLRTALQQRVQGPDEDVFNYIVAKRMLCYRLNKNMEAEEVLHHIYQGLDPDVRKIIYAFSPHNVDEVLRLAKNIERGNTVGASNNINVIERDRLKDALVDSVMGKIAKKLVIEAKSPNGANARRFTSGNSLHSRVRSGTGSAKEASESRTAQGLPRCFICNRGGHTAKFCVYSSGTKSKIKTKPKQIETQINIMHRMPSISVKQIGVPTLSVENELLYLEISLNDEPINAVIDTGSNVSIMSEELARKLEVPILPFEGLPVRTATGEAVKAFGECELPLSFQNSNRKSTMRIDVIVVKDFKFPLVLGNNFNIAAGTIIDFRNKAIVFEAPKNLNLLNKENRIKFDKFKNTFHICEEITIPPLTKVKIRATVSNKDLITFTCEVMPNKSIFKKQLIYAKNPSVDVSDGIAEFEIKNSSQKEQTIKRSAIIADYRIIGATQEMTCPEADKDKTNKKLPIDEFIEFVENTATVGKHLTQSERMELFNLLYEFEYIFAFDNTNIGTCEIFEHRINTGDAKPIHQMPYRYSI